MSKDLGSELVEESDENYDPTEKFVWTGNDGNMLEEIDLTPTAKELEQAAVELAERKAKKSK